MDLKNLKRGALPDDWASAPIGHEGPTRAGPVFIADLLAGATRRAQLMSDVVASIQQKEIGRSSRQLSDEGALIRFSQLITACELKTHYAVGRILFHRVQACAGQLFSQRQSELS